MISTNPLSLISGAPRSSVYTKIKAYQERKYKLKMKKESQERESLFQSESQINSESQVITTTFNHSVEHSEILVKFLNLFKSGFLFKSFLTNSFLKCKNSKLKSSRIQIKIHSEAMPISKASEEDVVEIHLHLITFKGRKPIILVTQYFSKYKTSTVNTDTVIGFIIVNQDNVEELFIVMIRTFEGHLPINIISELTMVFSRILECFKCFLYSAGIPAFWVGNRLITSPRLNPNCCGLSGCGTGGNGLLAGWLLVDVDVPCGRGCVKGTLLHCVPVSRDLVSFQNNAPAHMVTLMLYTCKIAFPSSRTVVLSLGCWTSVMMLVMKLTVLQMIDTMKPDARKSLALSMMVARVALPSSEIFHCDMIYTNPIFHVYFRYVMNDHTPLEYL